MIKERTQACHFESRWPVILAIFAVLVMGFMLPGRIRLAPLGGPLAVGIAMMLPILAVHLSSRKERWLRIEHTVTLIFCAVIGIASLVSLKGLVAAITIRPEDITGLQILSSSIVVWIINVLTFSLVYWQIDHGGPQVRASKVENTGHKPDWLFSARGSSRSHAA